MWVRKTDQDREADKRSNRLKHGWLIFAVICVTCAIVFHLTGAAEAIVFPFIIFILYRTTFRDVSRWDTKMMCTHCEKGMGNGDDGHGFIKYGTGKKKWYQVSGCDQPDKCDIVYMHTMKWVEPSNDEGSTD